MVKSDLKNFDNKTKLVVAGRNSFDNFGCVNPPVYHASTILFPTLADLRLASAGKYSSSHYGRYGTELTRRTEEAIGSFDKSDKIFLTGSGVSAITIAIMSLVKAGDHILISDGVYDPTRYLANTQLKGFGIETQYYDPAIAGDIEKFIKPNTKLIFTESPSSLSFELQDIPAICEVAKKHNVAVLNDNTWATALNFDPFEYDVDIVIQSATKYLGGHSDIMAGVIGVNNKYKKQVEIAYKNHGCPLSPDDNYLLLRGLRTLAIRLEKHQENALFLCEKLANHNKIAKILHPAYKNHKDNDLFKKYYKGSTGLFSIVLDKHYTDKQLAPMLDNLNLYGMGYSWGGYESLALPVDLKTIRTATNHDFGGTIIRIHAGLEDKNDLWQDLSLGLDRLG